MSLSLELSIGLYGLVGLLFIYGGLSNVLTPRSAFALSLAGWPREA